MDGVPLLLDDPGDVELLFHSLLAHVEHIELSLLLLRHAVGEAAAAACRMEV